MRYMLVNAGPGGLQVNLFSPDRKVNHMKLNRNGPTVALNIKRGHAIDILPYFDGSVEKAHAALKFSRDVLGMWKPNMLRAKAYDDDGNLIDVDALLSGKKAVVEEKKAAPPPPPPVDDPPADEPPVDDPPADEPPVDDPPADEPPVDNDVTRPDMGEGATLAAVDQHEAEMRGEANETKAPDDMTALKHVGEALEQKLYEAGFTTYAAVAEADPEVLKELVGSKYKEVQKQAKKLAK